MNKTPSDKKGNKPVVRAKRVARPPVGDPVEERLSSIYRDEQGDLPDFDQLDRKRSFWWLRTTVWIVIIACAVSVTAWVGFLVWRPWRSDGPPAIALRIEAPTALAPGKEEEIRIQWENTGLRPIQAADIRVFLPTDFVLQQAAPQATSVSSSLWSLGLVPPQQKGSIVLRGVFYGSADRQATIQALATYRHGSVEREKQLAETLRLAYATSTVDGLLIVPERMLPGDQVALRYQVTNRSDQVLGPLSARFNLPEGFIVSASSSPGLNQTGQLLTFPITRLPPGSMTTLQVIGSMLSGHPGDAVLTAAVGRTDPRGAFVALSASEKRSIILAGDLGLRLIVNGSPTEAPIDADAPLRVTLAYENTSGETLKDVSLSLVAESFVNGKRQAGTSGLIAWSDLQDLQRAATNTKGVTQTLKLSAAQVPSLASLPVGAKGSFDWILPIRLAPTGTKDGVIQLAALAHIDRVGETPGSRDVRLTPLALRYKSDADVRVFARYSTEEGAPIGAGPLPPQVGKTTDYRIVWQLTKRVHELGEVVVRAKLPAIAVWTKSVQVDKGTLTYDEKTREVRWAMSNVPLASGNVVASFDLQVTPERADVGRFAPLIGEATFEARDLQLNTPLSRVKPALTTDLPDDEVARGRGVVR
jgi:hypothetical protein